MQDSMNAFGKFNRRLSVGMAGGIVLALLTASGALAQSVSKATIDRALSKIWDGKSWVATTRDKRAAEQVMRRYKNRNLNDVLAAIDARGRYVLIKGASDNLNALIGDMQSDPAIQSVSRNWLYSGALPISLDSQDEAHAASGNGLWHLDAIGADAGFRSTPFKRDVLIAVIDSGFDMHHPALVNRYAINRGEIAGNSVDDDNNGYVDDVRGYDFGDGDADASYNQDCSRTDQHGTHVAGLIAAENWHDNQGRVEGIAPQAMIMPLKVGKDCQVFDAGLMAAMDYAIDMGADIVNLSLSGPVTSPTWQGLMQKAMRQNVLVVMAASNNGLPNDTPEGRGNTELPWLYLHINEEGGEDAAFGQAWPASYAAEFANALSVAASAPKDPNALAIWSRHRGEPRPDWRRWQKRVLVRDNGQLVLHSFETLQMELYPGSNFGAKTVSLMAPGAGLRSTVPLPLESGALKSSSKLMSGTSMAAPVTTGVAALLMGRFPKASAADIKKALMASISPVPELSDKLIAPGAINASAAAAWLQKYQQSGNDPVAADADPALPGRPNVGTPPPEFVASKSAGKRHMNLNELIGELGGGNGRVQLRVEFESGTARLTPLARQQLDILAKAMRDRQLRARQFNLVGHTDAVGPAKYNQTLSERRAQAVMAYLVDMHGLDQSRLVAEGRGETALLNILNPESGENRRVEIINAGRYDPAFDGGSSRGVQGVNRPLKEPQKTPKKKSGNLNDLL